MLDKSQRRPIIDPIVLALKSRRVIIALAALLVGLLVAAVPDLGPLRGELITLVTALALALIGGYSVEDAARLSRDRSALPPETLRELVKDALDGLIDEIRVEKT
jgi:hypothetical protein